MDYRAQRAGLPPAAAAAAAVPLIDISGYRMIGELIDCVEWMSGDFRENFCRKCHHKERQIE